MNALEILKHSGWVKGTGRSQDGSVCLGMALRMSHPNYRLVKNWAADETLSKILKEYYPDRCEANMMGGVDIPSFNDHPDTTLEDIKLVLEKYYAEKGELADESYEITPQS